MPEEKDAKEQQEQQQINREMGKRLRSLRQQYGFSQQKVAAYLQIHQTTYSDYELGKLNIPIAMVLQLADFYHIPLKDILPADATSPLSAKG